jgi:hypothetical protein
MKQMCMFVLGLFLVLGQTQAATVTPSLTGTFPVVGSAGQAISPAFGIRIDVTGTPNGRNPSVIVVCTVGTLHADGSLSCDTTQTISLVQGHNYQRVKSDGTNTFPMTINKTLIIASDVPCGVTYNVNERLSGNTGSGVDFGGGATYADLPFAIEVTCPLATGCTLTQGFWKTHPNAWPLASLSLGGTSYTKVQLLSVLTEPVAGNGSISLAHQLIAAKLNIANGADGSTVAAAISSADSLIGSLVVPPVGNGFLDPSSTGALTGILDTYNNGAGGPPHCE